MMEKEKMFSDIKLFLEQIGLDIVQIDSERPWGGFFVINETDAEKFIDHFFPAMDKSLLLKGKLSPKILLVQPAKKLSWQYHHRRAEIWKLIQGNAAVARSETDVENETMILNKGEIIELKQGERHRLIGLDEWGVIAEIWMHTDETNPSDEEDIIRIQDDFGR
jgi:mannose-6-phosphate isomerase-like protein (cupin superfamily)